MNRIYRIKNRNQDNESFFRSCSSLFDPVQDSLCRAGNGARNGRQCRPIERKPGRYRGVGSAGNHLQPKGNRAEILRQKSEILISAFQISAFQPLPCPANCGLKISRPSCFATSSSGLSVCRKFIEPQSRNLSGQLRWGESSCLESANCLITLRNEIARMTKTSKWAGYLTSFFAIAFFITGLRVYATQRPGWFAVVTGWFMMLAAFFGSCVYCVGRFLDLFVAAGTGPSR